MGTDHEAKEALLSEAPDPFQGSEKTTLQRRRNRQSITSSTNRQEQNGNREYYDTPDMAAKQQFSLNQVMILLAIYLGGGTLCFYLVRNQISGRKTNGILDAVYFCVVTMTTVGYGDLVPNTVLAKLLACAYVFTGLALGGLILGKAADYIVEKQELLLVRAMHIMRENDVCPTELLKEVETHKVKYKFGTSAVILFVLVIVGTVFLCSVEDLQVMDAFYCVCSTITTLGQRSLVKWILTRKLTSSDLEAADLDHDKVVSAAEFVLYKLKEMDKISQEDISVLMESFKELDVDHSGTLTSSDLISSQSA
ncbi:two-pore potassium channel 1 isoform X2 [Morus notabilis]|uniref:two-pore potassium channel 1 isoform X2 n=1 Tax=Morus notabilis TaxID=981085 RepID=UPI000CED01D9|nr:two-pore potassium channel 1 isoform X2 [Morus notabilis]